MNKFRPPTLNGSQDYQHELTDRVHSFLNQNAGKILTDRIMKDSGGAVNPHQVWSAVMQWMETRGDLDD